MPSIFNHENACWGIKRSCDVFHYDFSEEFQTNKLREVGHPSNSNNTVSNANYVHYSVSSNGYYGYQPHKVAHVEANCNSDMDICVTPNSPEDVNMLDYETSNREMRLHNMKRKRHIPGDNGDSSKRIRQEECGGGGGTSLRCNRHRPNRVDWHDDDYESTTQLLRQTHGCELYQLERTCDY